MSFIIPALNTVKASRWEMFKARLLGMKYIAREDGFVVVLYKYKGKVYISSYKNNN